MPDAPRRCEGCGSYVDSEDLFCSHCGREAPRPPGASEGRVEEGFVGFDCESCGASLTYDATADGMKCSFCGSVSLKRQARSTGRIAAASYIPFEVAEDEARRRFRRWISRGWFRPFGIRESSRVVSMQAVYIPFWRFRAETDTYYAADSSRTPPGASADWCPVSGRRSGVADGVLVSASGSLLDEEIKDLGSFDFSRAVPYRRDDLRGHAVEDYGVGRRGARPRARLFLNAIETAACAQLVPERSRNVHANVLVRNMTSEPVLLPVWINAYRFREQVYRFCVNGQTGAVAGRAPFSYAKVALVGLAAVVLVLAILAVSGLLR